MKISANLGFLWAHLPLTARIEAAQGAGFDAVECHFPYDEDAAAVRAALDATGLGMLGLNTWPGDRAAGEFGLAAVKGQEARAREAILQAVDYASRIGARNVHVMAGKDGDRATFAANLAFAAEAVQGTGIGLLIEPINRRDVPGYFLSDMDLAAALVAEVGGPLRIMFDCYHLGMMGVPVLDSFHAHRDRIGHVQFAGVPDRAEPDRGEIDMAQLLSTIAGAGYTGCFGAEHVPTNGEDPRLDWLASFRAL